MPMERRDQRKRADILRRIAQWISAETSPVGQVPPDIASPAAGRRILRKLAFRGLIGRVGWGWVARAPLVTPAPLQRIDLEENGV